MVGVGEGVLVCPTKMAVATGDESVGDKNANEVGVERSIAVLGTNNVGA